MHHDPSGPGVALEKSTTPEKSGSSGSSRWGTDRSGVASGAGSASGAAWVLAQSTNRKYRDGLAWREKNHLEVKLI